MYLRCSLCLQITRDGKTCVGYFMCYEDGRWKLFPRLMNISSQVAIFFQDSFVSSSKLPTGNVRALQSFNWCRLWLESVFYRVKCCNMAVIYLKGNSWNIFVTNEFLHSNILSHRILVHCILVGYRLYMFSSRPESPPVYFICWPSCQFHKYGFSPGDFYCIYLHWKTERTWHLRAHWPHLKPKQFVAPMPE